LHEVLRERYGFEADLTHFPIAGRCSACARSDRENQSSPAAR
jgi:hypothetical protein